MRCISPHAGYQIEVFSPRVKRMPDRTGVLHEFYDGESHSARFDRGGLLDHEIELALESFTFSGLAEGVNPLTHIGVYDSEAYVQQFPAEEREDLQDRIDARLRELQVRNPSQFICVDQPAAQKPWASYDNETAEEIIDLQPRICSPEVVRRYEFENEGREEILGAMEALEAEAADEEKIVVSA